ncbi:MAG: transglutaminase N-terminal domain-containing protein, partial [Mycobacterium sp.]
MWRLRVLHATGYAYPSPATASYNEARLTPRSDSRQNVVLNRVETVPATRSYRYIDYWGTAVTAFDLHAPHVELTVTSSSVVETDRPEPPTEKLTGSDMHNETVIDRFDEVLRPTKYTPVSKRIAAMGKRIAKDHEPADAVIAAAEWVRSELDYV